VERHDDETTGRPEPTTSPSSEATDVNTYSSSVSDESTLSRQQTTTAQLAGDDDDQLSTGDLVLIVIASCVVACLLALIVVGVRVLCLRRHGRSAAPPMRRIF